MKVTTPLGDYHYHYPGLVENMPQWHVVTESDPEYEEIPLGECWYAITIPLAAGKCIGYCENISPDVSMDDIVCEFETGCCCDEVPEEEECPEGRLVAATGTWKLSGLIRYAMRELISDG